MSAANPALRATVEGFNDATPYDPLSELGGDMTEEQMAHFIGSNSHSPNPPSSGAFSPPSAQAMDDEPPPSEHVQHRDSDLFSFARIDSGFRVGSGFSQYETGQSNSFATTKEPGDGIVSGDTPIEGPPSRKSSGLATLSAHSVLLSPTLTNSSLASPNAGSFVENVQPYKLLGGGEEMTRLSSLSTGQGTSTASHMQYQHTPISKGVSSQTSPEPPVNGHLTSPIVRVSRHESPGRLQMPETYTGKRTFGDPSFLAPTHGFDADDEDGTDRGRSGLSPSARLGNDVIPSINEQAVSRELDSRNALVEHWANESANLSVNTSYLDPNNAPGGVRQTLGRMRAKSTSKDSRQLRKDAFSANQTRRQAQNRSTPGPNVLVDEDSGEEYEDDDDDAGSSQESAPASVDGRLAQAEEATSPFGHLNPEEKPLESFPWIDPIYLPSREGEKSQPETANAAITRFLTRNQDIETASRAATWGTRRMSDSTLDQVLGETGFFSRLKLTHSKEKGDRAEDEARSSLQEGVAHVKQIYRSLRSNSVNKRKSSEPIRPVQRTDTYVRGVSPHSERPGHERNASSSSLEKSGRFSRSPSLRKTASRPNTPRLGTGALAAIQTAGLGLAGTSDSGMSPHAAVSPTFHVKEGFKRLKEGLHRHFSDDSSGSITDMMRKSGGPPVAPVATLSPQALQDEDPYEEIRTVKADGDDDDDARTTIAEPEKGVKMEMAPGKDLIIPNFDGFKTNIRDVNPRLQEWLVERLGQEQLRRYKRLVEYKIAHIRHVELGTCPSKEYCAAGDNFKRYFQLPKSAHKDSVSSADNEVSLDALDEDDQAIAEGAVSEAQFPAGLPMPPVERLPAEFECPFCFQVKKFTKPSDWSKHVHEDLQPFTCTFKHCSDPKSFKRKADWVRHENERHRQLEWWECTEENCQHRCYRRDNFVQHLIREHKLPEPPNKPSKQPNKPAVRGPAKNKGRGRGNTANLHDVPAEEKVLLMVEACRHETPKSANEEKCRFCNNVCNSWKKLTVHLARHMEQLSIPVLELVKIREVNVDTIISPLEQRPPMSLTPSPIEQQLPSNGASHTTAYGSPQSAYTAAGSTSSHMNMLSTAAQMQPGMFAPSMAMAQGVNPYASSHAHQQFANQGNLYDWSQQQQQTAAAMQFAAAGGGSPGYASNLQQPQPQTYGMGTANQGASTGQANFDTTMYMGDSTGGFAAQQQMPVGQWNTHPSGAQFNPAALDLNAADMGYVPPQQGGQSAHHQQNQQGQHQQQQYYGW